MKVDFDIEDYISGLEWSVTTSYETRAIVAGNLRRLHRVLLDKLPAEHGSWDSVNPSSDGPAQAGAGSEARGVAIAQSATGSVAQHCACGGTRWLQVFTDASRCVLCPGIPAATEPCRVCMGQQVIRDSAKPLATGKFSACNHVVKYVEVEGKMEWRCGLCGELVATGESAKDLEQAKVGHCGGCGGSLRHPDHCSKHTEHHSACTPCRDETEVGFDCGDHRLAHLCPGLPVAPERTEPCRKCGALACQCRPPVKTLEEVLSGNVVGYQCPDCGWVRSVGEYHRDGHNCGQRQIELVAQPRSERGEEGKA